MKITTSIATSHASRYLQQLCKHFAHKIETRYDIESGTCLFPHSTAHLVARESELEITIAAEEEQGLTRGRDVVWSHLVRFAFRENLTEPRWTSAAT